MGDGQFNNRGTKVYVGGLSDEVRKEDLEVEFQRYGKLNSVWVALNPPGFAFVEFAEWEDARAACEGLNNQELMGTRLRVEMSRGGGGRGRGGRGGRGRGGGGPTRGARGPAPPGGPGYGRRDFNNEGGAPRYRTQSPMYRPGGRDYGGKGEGGGFRRGGGGGFGRGSFSKAPY